MGQLHFLFLVLPGRVALSMLGAILAEIWDDRKKSVTPRRPGSNQQDPLISNSITGHWPHAKAA